MCEKKIKIFLGAYLNYTNAQNLNCLSIAKHLDSSKFITYALSTYFSPKVETKAILFHCFYPFRISSILGLLWGVIKCDIAYFPKHESTPNWIIKIAALLGKKIFTTIETNVCDFEKEGLLDSFGTRQKLIDHFHYVPNIFGITQYIIDNANCGVRLEGRVLYLGVEIDAFSQKTRKKLRNIVFVGSLTKRKRVFEYLQLAEIYPNIKFNIIGDGIDNLLLKKKAAKNVIFLGQLDQGELASKLNEMDLHVLTSMSEGFPKVILEAAASGIPSIVYSHYGASEWIIDAENGFVVNNFDQMRTTIKRLIDNEDLLLKNSEGALLMAKRFDWRILIKHWEESMLDLK